MPESSKSSSQMLYAPVHSRRWQLQILERRRLLMIGDAAVCLIAVLFSLRVWAAVAREPFNAEFIVWRVAWFFVMPGLWLLLASANDFYDGRVTTRRTEAMGRLFRITLQMMALYLMIFFLAEREALPRLFIFYYGVASFLLVGLWRLLNPALLGWASSPRGLLIVGADRAAELLIETLRSEAPDIYRVTGIISDQPEAPAILGGVSVVGDSSRLLEWITREGVTELALTSTREMSGDLFQAVMDAYERGVVITPVPILYERVTGRVPVDYVGNHWLVVLPIAEGSTLKPYVMIKWLIDKSLALIGMIVFLLLLPILALAIYFDSPGPIFYSQERVGLNGRLFSIIKFRTMVNDAEKLSGPVFAGANDPRVTRLGRFMRKTRLDELPQLINVLRGDMSLVGPRPERMHHVKRLQEKIPFYRTRHIVRPGLTGWAQVRYKYGADDEDSRIKLQYDLYYIRHRSLLLDLNILVRTVGKVLRMGGQ